MPDSREIFGIVLPCGRNAAWVDGIVEYEGDWIKSYNEPRLLVILNPNTQKSEYVHYEYEPPKLKNGVGRHGEVEGRIFSTFGYNEVEKKKEELRKKYRKVLPAEYLTTNRWLSHTGWITFQTFPCHLWMAMYKGKVLGGKRETFDEGNDLIEVEFISSEEILEEFVYFKIGQFCPDFKILESTKDMACHPW